MSCSACSIQYVDSWDLLERAASLIECCSSLHSSGFSPFISWQYQLYLIVLNLIILEFFTLIDTVLTITAVALHFDWSSVGVWITLISIVWTAVVLLSEIRAVFGICHMHFVSYFHYSLPHLLPQLSLQKLSHISVHGRPLCMHQ